MSINLMQQSQEASMMVDVKRSSNSHPLLTPLPSTTRTFLANGQGKISKLDEQKSQQHHQPAEAGSEKSVSEECNFTLLA